MSETVARRAEIASSEAAKRHKRGRRFSLHAFLLAASVVWLVPIAWIVYTALRPYADTGGHPRGYVSFGGAYNLDNFVTAWERGNVPHYFLNTLFVLVPAVVLVLLFASMMAFAVSRYSWRLNLALLLVFTGANLLPPQVIITPLFRMYLALPLPPVLSDNGVFYNQLFGLVVIHLAFQLGFCTFVLSNYMKTLPKELNEAAIVDGAGVARTYWSVILPLTRPALAALATLQVTWIYNDFFWAIVLMKDGARMPITSALNNLRGQYFVDNNMMAAGAIMVAIPTLIVFFALQKQFVSGLTLGSTKG
jgi:multiple sugar transport system permease protein